MNDVLALARRRYVRRRQLARRAVLQTRQAWARIDERAIRASWVTDVGPAVLAAVELGQYEAAAMADATVTAMLAAQGLDAQDAAGLIDPATFAGVASDGRDLATLVELSNLLALRQISQGLKPAAALNKAGRWLEMVVGTQVSDAGRVAGGVAITSRRQVSGFYRVLSPPSCSRCIVLAGKWFRWDAGFERHPRCDCGEVAADDGALEGQPQLWNPRSAFESMDKADQDRVFTSAGAQAIRDGADIGQVVNARSGMQTASIGGRDVLITTVGAGRPSPRQRRVGRPRLMPEQIYRIAGGDRDEAIRLLTSNGYLTHNQAAGARAA